MVVDKFPQTNTVKLMHEFFFFQCKTCYISHALYFLFVVVFFKCSQTVIIMKHIDVRNSIYYLETFKTLIK